MLFSPRGLQSTLLLVLLGLGHHDVEASEGKQVIHKRVGDSVVLSSNLPAEGVKRATWRYGDSNVAFQGSGPTPTNPFKGRLEFNDTSFSLTIRDLTIEDSGEFSLIAEVNDKQVSVFITLQVHEPISTNSIVFSNVTEAGSDGFCTVFLECKANPHSDVTYSWTVGTQTRNGSTLQYRITPQDGNTTFTCKASNVISEMLESTTLRCSETTGPGSNEGGGFSPVMFWFRLVVGLLVILVLVWLLYDQRLKEVFCSRFEQAAVVDRDPSQLDLNLSPLPGDALVYENSGGAADAQDDENIPPL
ncbi:SLAM family member 5-like isoform X1 [Xiphophorus maculatus]|uniref:SLAM family member 5-like isoform X1 n=1 Tax=Xiphophorus maculatus TaxID=8083 RepID=UPI000C6CA3C0|nr:SLAM family member 5-like isoform X1 [Xiphophorus maculatus]XP_023202175.1 SLAM family member 5-like isoform X1 [Xiphophorus maculatus]